jgi:molybdopterin-containing oxidoreductase family iron-sulfur binding subunit
LEEQLNPDVSVRTSGIMEKCTFCVQRIHKAQDRAKDENREVRDGEIQPACAQSCPAEAMVFGDLSNPNSKVSRLAKSNRGFRLLEELGTRPRVIYLKEGDS